MSSCERARVAKSADATDLKSVIRKGVRVQFPPRAPIVFVATVMKPSGAGFRPARLSNGPVIAAQEVPAFFMHDITLQR